MIERTFAWFTGYRRLTIRYERLASLYYAFVTLAAAPTCTSATSNSPPDDTSTRLLAISARDGVYPRTAGSVPILRQVRERIGRLRDRRAIQTTLR